MAETCEPGSVCDVVSVGSERESTVSCTTSQECPDGQICLTAIGICGTSGTPSSESDIVAGKSTVIEQGDSGAMMHVSGGMVLVLSMFLCWAMRV